MTAEDPIFACSGCGASHPRSDMFGVEPELLCETCSEGVRKRMHVRFRPLAKEHAALGSALVLAIAAVLFLASHVVWPGGDGAAPPAWLAGMYQSWDIWRGDVWEHATCMFLHGGLLHLLMNASFLWSLGRPLERVWGTPVAMGLLLATGIAGSAAQYIGSAPGGIGLSGGLMGLAGFLMARRKHHPEARALMDDRTMRFVLIWVVGCIVVTQLGLFNLRIGNAAHVVGLGTGYLFGLGAGHRLRWVLVPATGLLCAALVVASVFLAFGDITISRNGGQTWIEVPRTELRAEWLQQKR